jgi:hypothetical protein
MKWDRLDLARVGIATVVAAGLGLGLAVAFLRHAQSTPDVGPTSATLDEAFSSLLGVGIGLALGSALCAVSVRRGSPALSGLIAGLLAFVVVLGPVFIYTDDVSLDEDLSPGGLGFLAPGDSPRSFRSRRRNRWRSIARILAGAQATAGAVTRWRGAELGRDRGSGTGGAHSVRERADVVGPVVVAAVDEEGGCAGDGAQVGAVDVFGEPADARRGSA